MRLMKEGSGRRSTNNKVGKDSCVPVCSPRKEPPRHRVIKARAAIKTKN